jgi:hypothetical protein
MEVLRASGVEREPSQAKSIALKLAQKRSELSTTTWKHLAGRLGIRILINLLATGIG